MPLDTTSVDRSLLSNNPLTSVVCQVRFDPTPSAGEAKTVQSLLETLGGPDAYALEPVTETSVSISVGANPQAVAPPPMVVNGWRLRVPDGSAAILLVPSAVTFEVFDYRGWDDFSTRFAEVIRAVVEHVNPVFEQRLGLRYINQLTQPNVSSPDGWRGHIDDAFIGIGSNEEIGRDVIFSRQQAVIQLDEGARCTINQGFAPDDERDGALTYVLDFDVAREGVREFDEAGIANTAERFNAYALRLFQLATTASLRGTLA